MITAQPNFTPLLSFLLNKYNFCIPTKNRESMLHSLIRIGFDPLTSAKCGCQVY